MDSMGEQQRHFRTRRPTVAWASDDGLRLREEAEHLKKLGNSHLAKEKYEAAMEFYAKAICHATAVTNNSDQVASIHGNASHVLWLMRHFDHSLEVADSCIVAKPSWFKGYFRKMRALRGLNRQREALDVGLNLSSWQEGINRSQKVEIFIETLLLLTELNDYSAFIQAKIDQDVWEEAVTSLIKRGAWEVVSIIYTGRAGCAPILSNQDRSQKDVDLASLLQGCSVEEWKTWGEQLAIWMLQNGATVDTMAVNGERGLRAALEMAIRSGAYSLLAHVLGNHSSSINTRLADGKGNTLLHEVCGRGNFPSRLEVIQLLLRHLDSSSAKNSQGKTALDLLSVNDPDREEIERVIRESDNRISTPVGVQKFGTVPSASPIIDWKEKDLTLWVSENDIEETFKRLQGMTGAQLLDLALMLQNDPVLLYQLLYENLQLPLTQILKVTSALRNLTISH